MKTIDRYLNRISLIRKILVIFVGCVVIPFILQMYLYFSETEQNIQAEIYERMEHKLTETANKVEASIYDALSVAVKYSYDMRFYQCLDKDYTQPIEYLVEYQENIQQYVNSDLPQHLQLDKISFHTDNPTLFNGSLVYQVVPFDSEQLGEIILSQSIYDINGEGDITDFRVGTRVQVPETTGRRTVAIIRHLAYYPQYAAYQKAMKLELNSTYYNNLLSETGLFTNLALVDPQEQVLFCANTFRQAGPFEPFDRKALGDDTVILSREIKGLPLTLYGYYGANMIRDQFIKSIPKAVAVLAVSITIAALCILLIGNNLSKRTRAIVEQSKRIARGDFSEDMTRLMEPGNDEIAQIEKSIGVMSLQLREYIDREYTVKLTQSRMERETAQAKLMALQSQVNPHFLFNALESIRLNALESDRKETVQMIKCLARMFRYLVDWEGDIILLQKELEFLDEFLSIQKYRFGSEFSYEIDVQKEAKACLVPKLILQPLVENACVHGVEATSNSKAIQISVSLEGEWVVLRVQDNGGGIAPDRLAAIRDMLQGGAQIPCSVGLYNVYQRLLLHYRDAFSFEVFSQPGEGTCCVVRVPLRYA